jgi:hypothetical protein
MLEECPDALGIDKGDVPCMQVSVSACSSFHSEGGARESSRVTEKNNK